MTANINPIFTLTPNTGKCLVDAANTESDGTGDLVTLFTAGANGSKVDYIRCINAQSSVAVSSAMVARFFVTDTGGINPILLEESAIPAATRAAGVVGSTVTVSLGNGLNLASGQLIKVCQSVYAGAQDLMHYTAVGGDY